MHTARLAIAALLAVPLAAAAQAFDLNRPGALEQLEKENPAHHARVVEIVKAAAHMPCQPDKVARTLKARFDADDGQCAQFIRTSYPAKMHYGFRLEQTTYKGWIELSTRYDRFVPLVERPR
jgi:hypothetical protein